MERPLDVDLLRFADTWDIYLPLKMATTIWRMFQNKIPLKDDLLKRGEEFFSNYKQIVLMDAE
jgi:hypothetical protein